MTPCEGVPFAQVTGAQAFLAWDTNHVLSMGPCGDDQHRPGGAAGPAREDGPAVTVLPCLALTTDPKVRHGRTSPLSCKASCGQLPGVPRRRTLPSLCHSLRGSS